MLGGLEYTRAELVKKQKEADDALKKCKTAHPTSATSSCKDEQSKVDEIKEALAQNEIDAAATADTAQASSGAGIGDTLNKLLPIATMGIMACMALGCFDKKDEQPDNSHALLPNGAIDCSKADAGQYSDCDQYLVGQCSAQSGMLTMTPNCSSFTARFCAQGPPQPGAVQQLQLENGAVVQLNIGGTGVGQDQPYCQTTYATAYCKDGANAACPACLQLQAGQSQACQANPALCIAQNSPSQVADAERTCPGDPAIALYERTSGAFTGGVQAPHPSRCQWTPRKHWPRRLAPAVELVRAVAHPVARRVESVRVRCMVSHTRDKIVKWPIVKDKLVTTVATAVVRPQIVSLH